MKQRAIYPSLFLCFLPVGAAIASMESISWWKAVRLETAAGEYVLAETTENQEELRRLEFFVQGKQFQLPKNCLTNVKFPDLASIELRHSEGSGPGPVQRVFTSVALKYETRTDDNHFTPKHERSEIEFVVLNGVLIELEIERLNRSTKRWETETVEISKCSRTSKEKQ